MMFSVNNRFVLEPYVKEGLRKENFHGIATPGQRDSIKGLKVLIDGKLPNGDEIPAGSIAYIREETLHTQEWASKLRTCDTFTGKFMLVELSYIEFFNTPTKPTGDAA